MATLILIAVGLFAMTITTQDVRIAGRIIGERRALSAAESGAHAVLMQLNPVAPVALPVAGICPAQIQIDPASDPGITYCYPAQPARNPTMPTITMPGFDLSRAYVGAVFDTTITGQDNNYGTTARIAMGSAYAPNPSDTQQGNQ
jgi:hypothetical protein